MFMEWLRKAPTALVIAASVLCGVVTLAVLGGYIALEFAGRDTSGYLAFVSFLLSATTALASGTAAVGSVSAAKSAAATERQTNGTLTAKDTEIEELRERIRQMGGDR